MIGAGPLAALVALSDTVLLGAFGMATAAITVGIPATASLILASRSRATATEARDGCDSLADAVQELYGHLAAERIAKGLPAPQIPQALTDYLAAKKARIAKEAR